MHRALARLVAVLATLVLPGVTHAETVYFVSKSYGGLYSFDTSGTTITTLSGTGSFESPSALALGPDGNLYVGDAAGGGRISRFTLSSGSVTPVAALNGASPTFAGGPVNPAAIAFTRDGGMLVGRNPEVAFFPGGVEAWPGGPVLQVAGWREGESPSISPFTAGSAQNYAPGLAVSADGRLYASNSFYDTSTLLMTGNVLGFLSTGTFQSDVTAGNPPIGLFGPAGLALVGDSLFVASTMNGSIFKTNLLDGDTASNTTFFTMTPIDPISQYPDFIGPLAALPDGSLLTGSVDVNQGWIYLFDGSGGLVTTFAGPEYGQIGGIVAVPEPATLWLACGAATCVLLRCLRRRRV
jgi:sugar lactone lactonase YvrE